jgi:hypothetical protein
MMQYMLQKLANWLLPDYYHTAAIQYCIQSLKKAKPIVEYRWTGLPDHY